MPRTIEIKYAAFILAAFTAFLMIVFWYRGTPDMFTWPILLLNVVNIALVCFGEVKILQFLRNTPDSSGREKDLVGRIKFSSVYTFTIIWSSFYLGTLVPGGVHFHNHPQIAGWWN